MSHSITRQLTKPLPLHRLLLSYGMGAIATILTSLALLPLCSLLSEILSKGLPGLKWETFTALPAAVGEVNTANGFANAIQGTALMVGIAVMISVPIGILTAIYLAEFSQERWIAQIIRLVISTLSAVPSIIVGVFAYGVVVLATIFNYRGFSALAGGFALGMIMLPIVILSSEEALKLVPVQQRLASAALGANSLQTTIKIVLSSALPSILTGILLAIARAAGETAPLLFTALFSQSWVEKILNPAPSLSVMIYNYASSASSEQNALAWTAALVLLGIIFITSTLSRLITRKL
jgi:phosphate transport system permease protein